MDLGTGIAIGTVTIGATTVVVTWFKGKAQNNGNGNGNGKYVTKELCKAQHETTDVKLDNMADDITEIKAILQRREEMGR